MKRRRKANPAGGSSAAHPAADGTRWGQGNLPQDPGEEAAAAPWAPASRRLTISAAGLIVLAAVAAYHNSLAGPFVYDDVKSIPDNPTIRRLWPVGQVLSPPRGGETVSGRPLLNLSLAVNYALGGLKVGGYHATNLGIHIAAALLLFGILRRTFVLPGLRDRFGRAATPLALAGALVWTLHPLQTESVTYVVQRAESLAGFLYLLTLYCVIRGAAGTVPFFAPCEPVLVRSVPGEKGDCPPSPKRGTVPLGSPSPCATASQKQCESESAAPKGTVPFSLRENWDCPLLWYLAAVLACLLGMACKEVMVTAPLVTLLYDRTFLGGSFKEAWRRRWRLYVGLAATWGLLAYLVFSTGLLVCRSEAGMPYLWGYARSQPGVILHYLRLSVWPSTLCLSYEWPVAGTFGEIFPGTMVMGVLAAASVWGLMRRRTWGFLGAWLLLILAPTSSVLPLGQLAFEHRMYLSLAAVAVLAVAGGYALWDRLLPRPAGPKWDRRGSYAGQPCATASQKQCESGSDTACSKQWHAGPSAGLLNYRAMALRWTPPVAVLAAVLLALGYATVARNADYRSSVAIWQDTVDKRPHNALAHNSLGHSLAALGRTGEAIEHYATALRLKPHWIDVHNNLGVALAGVGKTDAAIEHYRQALRIKPDCAETHNNLGLVLVEAGRAGEAIEHCQQALQLEPDYANAHNSLGNALTALGRTGEAIQRYHEALRLKPDYAEAHYNLANVLASLGRTGEAIEHYRQALRLKPDFMVALHNLAWLLASREPGQGGDPAQAVRLAERAHELAGRQNARCLDTLAVAYAAAGRFPEAILTAQRAIHSAESTGQTPLARLVWDRLQLYRAGRPYREAPRLAGQTRPYRVSDRLPRSL